MSNVQLGAYAEGWKAGQAELARELLERAKVQRRGQDDNYCVRVVLALRRLADKSSSG